MGNARVGSNPTPLNLLFYCFAIHYVFPMYPLPKPWKSCFPPATLCKRAHGAGHSDIHVAS